MTATSAPRANRHPSKGPRLDLRDERGSLPLLMMVILVGVVLSTYMVSVVVAQTTSTRFTTSREQALNAAQAGTDVALAAIRDSTIAGAGTLAGLPCWTHRSGSPYSGAVVSDSAGTPVGSGRYSVFVDYYMSDPVVGGRDPATDPGSTMVCSPGYGTFDPSSGQSTPSFALITSTGTVAGGGNGTSAGRTLVSTYVFLVDNRNISGGLIRLYPAGVSAAPVCLESANATPDPVAATTVSLALCSTTKPPSPKQVFAYRTDLTIQLISSITPTNPDGVCLDGGNPLANNAAILLKRCAPLTAADPFSSSNYWQQWSFNDNGHLQGSTSLSRATGNLATLCINATSQNPATAVINLTGCAGSIDDPSQAWIPSPDVGAGAATEPRPDGRQYVNFGEFGRCMDVTDQNPGSDHFILYPCKQNPSRLAGTVAWNQIFTFTPLPLTPPYGQLRTVAGGTTYCVTSPGTLGGYVRLSVCTTTDTTLAPRQRWVQNDGNNALPYSVKYTLVDSLGNCLGLTLPVDPQPWSTLDVEKCDGSREQKWNAAANLSETTLQNTIEK